MITKSYSIEEASDQFEALVQLVQTQKQPVYVTRQGKAVAVILSAKEYELLPNDQTKPDFWQSYQTWRKTWQVDEWTEDDDPFANLRHPG